MITLFEVVVYNPNMYSLQSSIGEDSTQQTNIKVNQAMKACEKINQAVKDFGNMKHKQ
jgi:hypothetical protein